MPELEKRLAELEKMLGEAPPAPVPSWRDYLQDGEVENSPEGRAFGVLRQVYRQALAELGEVRAEEICWAVFIEADYKLRHDEWGPTFADEPEDLRRYIDLGKGLWEAGAEGKGC